MLLWTAGYGAWPVATRAERLVAALHKAEVNLLVDVRLSPCASDPVPGRPYGPRRWNLQAGSGEGIATLLAEAEIAYEWMVELGNPQRQDPAMTVLRAHLADPAGAWPVHRGLERLAEAVRRPGRTVALLCACPRAGHCHRTVIADALNRRHFAGTLEVRDVGRGQRSPADVGALSRRRRSG